MSTLFVSHPATVAHDMGPGHPERPDRIKVVMRRFEDPEFRELVRVEAPEAQVEDLSRAHPRDFVEALASVRPEAGTLVQIDSDTLMNSGTWEAASRATGGAVLATDRVMTGQIANAFVATRPPGHHAERQRPMGFCFVNHVAVAARYAQAVHGAERVAIVDFDVHHGNGTQDIFWDDPTVLYASTHQMPLYPGTGAVGERGTHDTIVNAPLPPGADGDLFRDTIEARIVPRVEAFRPDLIILSAGFDAHRRDPLGGLALVEADFAWVTRRFMDIADRICGGKIVSVLEGGYDLEALAGSAAAHVSELMGRTAGTDQKAANR